MKKRNQVRKNSSPAATTPQRKSAAASQRKTTHGRGSNHDAPAAFSEPETMIIMGGNNDNLVRDLDGRLFIVNDEKSCTHEIGYSDALDYCTKHGNWKNPWKVLALHGIKAPSPAPQAKRIPMGFRRVPLGKSGVRLQFYFAETGKKWVFVDFKTELMAIVDRAAKRARMNVGQFVMRAVEVQLPSLETQMQAQERAVA